MRNLFKALMLSLLTVFVASSVWANSPTDHVKIAPNNKGDVLHFPMYAAIAGGFETKFTVVNTSTDTSSVAKLVVRSQRNSQELLDFLIYLTPTDVWTGTLKFDPVDGPIMYSEDDSVLAEPGEFASAKNPFTAALAKPDCDDDMNLLGYVNIINSATTDEYGSPPVDKEKLYDWYNGLTSISNEVEPQNVLAGWMDFNIADLNLTAGLNAVTLRDYKNEEKLTVAQETRLGLDKANNNLLEVEAALSKDHIAMPYVKGNDISLHFMTFPTKFTEFDGCTCEGAKSPFFSQNNETEGCEVVYSANIYDTEEETTTTPKQIVSPAPKTPEDAFIAELNWVTSTVSPFSEGWINYDFKTNINETKGYMANETDDIGFTGVPAVPTVLNVGASGLSLKYAAWSDGEVTSTSYGGPLEDYQYSDAAAIK